MTDEQSPHTFWADLRQRMADPEVERAYRETAERVAADEKELGAGRLDSVKARRWLGRRWRAPGRRG